MGSTSPSVDDKNCFEFVKESLSVDIKGDSQFQAGLSYNLDFKIEKPAHGLKIIPRGSINGLSFEPKELVFDDFWKDSYTLTVKIRGDIIPGDYMIHFDKEE